MLFCRNPKDFLLLFDDVTMKSKAQHVMEFNPMVHVPAPPPHPGSKLAQKKVRGSCFIDSYF